ncbi:Hypothetical protein D9617_119g039670 [Elsinoe fawcettii]|nr:Hypothetical protein D9617_119g039670 [Elsinoe fawcettii]
MRWQKDYKSACAGFTRSGKANEGVFRNIEVPVPGTFLLGMDANLSVKVSRRQREHICQVISDIVFAPAYRLDRRMSRSNVDVVTHSQGQQGIDNLGDDVACNSGGWDRVHTVDKRVTYRVDSRTAWPRFQAISDERLDKRILEGCMSSMKPLPDQQQAHSNDWDYTTDLADDESCCTVPAMDEHVTLAAPIDLSENISNRDLQLASLQVQQSPSSSVIDCLGLRPNTDVQYWPANHLFDPSLFYKTCEAYETWSMPSQQGDIDLSSLASRDQDDFILQYGYGLV